MDELNKALKRNGEFSGTKMNAGKKELLEEITTLCKDYQDLSFYCKVLAEPPNNRERNSFVTLVQPLPAMIMSARAKEILSSLIAQADSVFFANSDAGLTISFGVENIWEE